VKYLKFPRNSQCILTTLLELSLTLYITISLKLLTLGNASSVGCVIPRLKAFIYSKQRGGALSPPTDVGL